MGFEPSACAVVEDSLPGIQAGMAAGMRVVAFQPYEIDPQIPSDVLVIKHLSELKTLLSGHAAEPGVAADGAAPRS